jgi:polysaccharide export outer membrane protein
MLRRFALAAAVLSLLAGQAPAQEPPRAGGYRIGPKDKIAIRVFEVPDLNVELRVGEEGTISLPLVGDVKVDGFTDAELAAHLERLLEANYVNRATVTVQVVEFRSRPIWVLGAVKTPGPLPFSGRWTLLEAIAAAGGVADGNGGVIQVLRRAENGLSDQISIPVEELVVRADPKANIPIVANDFINVPPAGKVTVLLVGEVAQSGAIVFASTDRITVLAAMARAGGLGENASRKLLIKRQGPDGKEEVIPVDYKAILAGDAPDLALRDGDVIVVKESFF